VVDAGVGTADSASPAASARRRSRQVRKISAEHLRLGQRHQQLARGQAPVPLFDRSDRVVERGDHTQPADQLSDRHHARDRRQRRVRSTDPNPTCQTAHASHRTGAFPQQMI
jgi:hypothetical protein